MAWQVAATHDNEAGLADMVQQPTAPGGIAYPEMRFSASGGGHWHGTPYCELQWNVIRRMTRNALLQQFGLGDSVSSAPVTVTIRDNSNVFRNYNATATLVNVGSRAAGRWEGLTIRLTRLEPIAIVIAPEPAVAGTYTVDPTVVIG